MTLLLYNDNEILPNNDIQNCSGKTMKQDQSLEQQEEATKLFLSLHSSKKGIDFLPPFGY